MRPQSIKMFDMLFLASLAIGLVNAFVSYETTMAELAATGFGMGFFLSIMAFSYGVVLLLWFFISRQASNIARWILVVLTGIGIVFMPFGLFEMPPLEMALAVIVTALQIGSIYFLFQPDAKLFFENKGEGSVDPTTFE